MLGDNMPFLWVDTHSKAIGTFQRKFSLMTPLGLIEADALTYLEEQGTTSLSQLMKQLDYPKWMILMGVGSLVRGGVIQANASGRQVMLECLSSRDIPMKESIASEAEVVEGHATLQRRDALSVAVP